MAEASLLFPISMIALSSALTGYLYHRDIAQGIQSCCDIVSRLISRLIQSIDKEAKHTARWAYNITANQYADNANLEAGAYELIESPSLQHHGLLAAHLFSSGVDAPSTNNLPGSPGTLVRALLSDDDSGNSVPNDLREISIRSGGQAQAWQSRENRHNNDRQRPHQHRPVVNVMMDADITPADWEIEAAGRHAWFHGMVDRVVDKFWTELEPEVVEVVDTV